MTGSTALIVCDPQPDRCNLPTPMLLHLYPLRNPGIFSSGRLDFRESCKHNFLQEGLQTSCLGATPPSTITVFPLTPASPGHNRDYTSLNRNVAPP